MERCSNLGVQESSQLLPSGPVIHDTSATEKSVDCCNLTRGHSSLIYWPTHTLMATLHIGAQCATCKLVDFLPFICPHCSATFCGDHVHHHTCADSSIDSGPIAGSSRHRVRGTCPTRGCNAETIESLGGYEDEPVDGGRVSEEKIAREVRCTGCLQAFCLV